MKKLLFLSVFSILFFGMINPLNDPSDPIKMFFEGLRQRDSVMLADAFTPEVKKEFTRSVNRIGGFKGMFSMNPYTKIDLRILRVEMGKPHPDTATVAILSTITMNNQTLSDSARIHVCKNKSGFWKISDLQSAMKKRVE